MYFICRECGKEFVDKNNKKRIYCSKVCANKYSTRERNKAREEMNKGFESQKLSFVEEYKIKTGRYPRGYMAV